MDKEENANQGNSIKATSTDPNHKEQAVSAKNGENTALQVDINNPAKFNFESSARITPIQRSSTVGRSSSPPPPSSIQENRSNFIQRRKSTPSWTLSREVKYIKKDRRKKNVEQMLVVFQNDKNDIGRWTDVSELNCPQLIAEYWERKKQMKESNLNNGNSSEKQSNSKKTGSRTIKEIVGMIPSQEHKYLYAVIFNDSTAQEYVLWKEMRKYYSKQLLKFYESHIDQDNFTIAPPSSISSILPEIPQISHRQSQPQIQPQNQRHHHHQQQSHPHPQQQILTEANNLHTPTQIEETQKKVAANEEEKKVDETENKNEVNNSIPIFLMNDQSSQIIHNLSIPKIQGLQSQAQLQRITKKPSPKEQTRSSQPQILSQLIQQNSMIMNRK